MSQVDKHDEIQGAIVHEYDGILEADNRLPLWWLITFYGAIAFSLVYWFTYHEFEALPTPSAAYAQALLEGGSDGEADAETLEMLANDPGAVAGGQEAFLTTCAACHGQRAEGLIGPNLTDDRWLHGGSSTDMYRAIRTGIAPELAKLEGSAGMPPWGPQLGERRVRSVVAYLLSIRDTNEAGRGPEGERYSPGAEAEAVEPAAEESPVEAPTEEDPVEAAVEDPPSISDENQVAADEPTPSQP